MPVDKQNLEGERLKYVLNELGKSPSRASLEIRFSASYLGKYITGARKGKPISQSILNRLSDHYNVSGDWVRTGKGALYNTPDPSPLSGINEEISEAPTDDFVELPYLSAFARSSSKLPSLSAPTEVSFVEMTLEQNHGLTETYPVPMHESAAYYHGLIVVAVHGDSMEPNLVEGDHVLCRVVAQRDWAELSEGIYAVAFTDFFVIKRIINNDLLTRGQLVLHSDNTQSGGTITIREQDIRYIWQALEL